VSERLYLSPPYQGDEEQVAVLRALRSNWIAPLGPEIDAFETEIASVAGVDNCLVTSSGTAAIHLALMALGVGPGDVVIAPSFTFVATVNPVSYVGAELWLIDSLPTTWNLDPSLLEDALTAGSAGRSLGAVIAVDLFGQCADYSEIEEICQRFNVPLVVDAAESLGSSYRGRPAGSFGRVGVYSFNGNKIVTTSGGGALVSNDEQLVSRCLYLATQAREPGLAYEHSEVGFNYRMSNILAAFGRAQLSTLEQRVSARRALFDSYVERLESYDGLDFMPEAPHGRSNRWLTTLTVDPDRFGATNRDIIAALEIDNIEARPVWKPMHLQPVFARARMFGGSASERLFDMGVCLPSGTQMSDHDLDRVCSTIASLYSTS